VYAAPFEVNETNVVCARAFGSNGVKDIWRSLLPFLFLSVLVYNFSMFHASLSLETVLLLDPLDETVLIRLVSPVDCISVAVVDSINLTVTEIMHSSLGGSDFDFLELKNLGNSTLYAGDLEIFVDGSFLSPSSFPSSIFNTDFLSFSIRSTVI